MVSYEAPDGSLRAGVLVQDRIADLVDVLGADPTLAVSGAPSLSVRRFLELGDGARAAAEDASRAWDGPSVALSEVRLGPPVTDPEKILCLGLNYRDHALEAGMTIPSSPVVFAKYANSLAGPEDPIVLPSASHDVDYEAELAVVIGRRARHVEASDALAHVAGVMAFNDVSARDLQMSASQWTLGKAIDTFGPCGPALVSLDEIGDIQDLPVRARLNGEVMQDGTTADMIFGVSEVIALLSSVMTLVPGDILVTGTPAGVGMGRDPVVSLHPGDTIEVEIDGVGRLRNPVVAESEVSDPALALTTGHAQPSSSQGASR
jgi:2-keto-4-pentenoate hydratase/2-oxohepta-3-ene-1,7-dioic acid hydratase in catechol pathway